MTDATTDAMKVRVRDQLHDLLTAAAVPYQQIAPLIAVLLGDESPVVGRDAHCAAIKREVDWQHRWCDKFEQAARDRDRLQRLLDMTAVDRVDQVLRLLADVDGGRSGSHDDTCHQRHTGCLAARIRAALTEPLEACDGA